MLKKIKNLMTDHEFNFYITEESDEFVIGYSELYFYYLLNKYKDITKFPNDLKLDVLMKNSHGIYNQLPMDTCKFNFLVEMDIDKLNIDPVFVFNLINDFTTYEADATYFKAVYTYEKYKFIIDKFTLVYLIDFLCLALYNEDGFEEYLNIHTKTFS